jgi:hypothetical protein
MQFSEQFRSFTSPANIRNVHIIRKIVLSKKAEKVAMTKTSQKE